MTMKRMNKNKKSEGEYVMKRRPWLAGVLNLLFPGLGYIYIGKRKLFGILLIITGILILIDLNLFDTAMFQSPIALIVGIIGQFAFAYDAYNDAKS